eukprot:337064-Pelagomonas_calceolata.AAC.1
MSGGRGKPESQSHGQFQPELPHLKCDIRENFSKMRGPKKPKKVSRVSSSRCKESSSQQIPPCVIA